MKTLTTKFIACVVFTWLLMPEAPLNAQTLTEAYIFSSDDSGSESGGQYWNSDGGVFNLWVTTGRPGGNPDGLIGPLSGPINFPLHAGTNEFTIFGAPGAGNPGFRFQGLNLFFNSNHPPDISVKSATRTSASIPAFSANSGASTPGFNGVRYPGAGTPVFTGNGTIVTLADFFWATPSVLGVDRCQYNAPFPDGVLDYVGSFTLVVGIPVVTNQPPVAKCKDVTVSADSSCSGTASVDDGSFDPDGDSITVAQSPSGPYPLGTTSVTLTVVDSKGASNSCIAAVTVQAPLNAQTLTEAYIFSSDDSGSESGGQYWNSDGGVFNLWVTTGRPGGNPDGLIGPLSGPINFPLHAGTNEFTIFGAPGAGNPGFRFQGLNLFFNSNHPPDISVKSATRTSASIPAFSANSGASTPGFNGVRYPGAGTLVFTGNGTIVTLADFFWATPSVLGVDRCQYNAPFPDGVLDYVGSFTLVVGIPVVTNQPPVAKCKDVTVSADSSCSGTASVDDGSFDPDGDPIVVIQTPPGPYPLGTNHVMLTVTDNLGSSNSCAALVIVLDRSRPVINCPSDITVTNAHSSATSVVTFQPGAVDNCAGLSQIICSPASGSAFGIGTTNVQCSVMDASGNFGSCSFSVTVLPGNTAPVPIIRVAPLAHFPGYTNLIVISKNNTNAAVVFDGSGSYDVDDATFGYAWLEGPNLLSTNALTVQKLVLGTHVITLRLNDGFPLGISCANVTVEVISPAEAVAIIIGLLDASNLSQQTIQPLEAILRAAADAFDRGNFKAAVNGLAAFQNSLDAKVRPFDSNLADQLSDAAKTIIEAVKANQSYRGPKGDPFSPP